VLLVFVSGAVLGAVAMMLPRFLQHAQAFFKAESQNPSAAATQGLVHTHKEFEFVANAPIDIAAPLFGADEERVWAPGWDPSFIWPKKASDQPGMVFTVAHGNRKAIWVNTSFDLPANRIQYVYVLPDTVVTVITLKLAASEKSTHVAVTYERTALAENANDLVLHMAESDGNAGAEWGEQINSYLKTKS
jgi:hypothetical protein